MKNTGIATKLVIIYDNHAIRINRPWAKGFWRKLDKWLFAYSTIKYDEKTNTKTIIKKGLPCFLPMIKIKNQLVVDGERVYSGGGVNCFNEPIKAYSITVDKETLNQCKKAYAYKSFKIRNFEYNGFMGKLLKGHKNYIGKNPVKTNDPGIYKVTTSKDTIEYIPGYAIEGIEITYKTEESKKIPILFGRVS